MKPVNRQFRNSGLLLLLLVACCGNHTFAQQYININLNKTYFRIVKPSDSIRLAYGLIWKDGWQLAATPRHQTQQGMFPEMQYHGEIKTGFNRGKLNWFNISPDLYRMDGNLMPPNISLNETSNHYVRQVLETEVFPDRDVPNGIPKNQIILNLAYYPDERGPYNYDTDGIAGISAGIDSIGNLKVPESRWAGITRPIAYYYPAFYNDKLNYDVGKLASIEFWLMDPFIYNTENGGDLYFNIGDISEDILCDSVMFFEQGIKNPEYPGNNNSSVWGLLPISSTQENFEFSDNETQREYQDAGFDGMRNELEIEFFSDYLSNIEALYGDTSLAYQKALSDPSADDYHHYRGSDYDDDWRYSSILERYKQYNGTEGNSPTDQQNPENYPTASTQLPDKEDLNRDNVFNLAENYYQYKIHLSPEQMILGQNYIDDILHSHINLPNGMHGECKWYHFNIPIESYQTMIGNPPLFDSCRYMRIFLKNYPEPVVLRFGTLELVGYVENPQELTYDIYPNPADTYFKVFYHGFTERQLQVILIDMMGRRIIPTITSDTNHGFEVDVSDLKPGLYFIKIETSFIESFDYHKVSKIYIK
jgi:cell surface protein SprA